MSLQRATSGYSALISSTRVNNGVKYTLPAFASLAKYQRRWKASAVM